MSITKAVIPAAGLGTRLRPLTNAFPKELLPIGRKPVLAHIARELLDAGIRDALFIVNERKPQIQAYFGEAYTEEAETESRAGHTEENSGPRTLQCQYVFQSEQRGLGDALLYAASWVSDAPFAVAFGDCLMDSRPGQPSPLKRLLDTHTLHDAAASVIVERVDWNKVSRYGVIAPEVPLSEPPTAPFSVRDVIEKPPREAAPSNLVVAARWVLTARIFDALKTLKPDVRGEINLTDAVRTLRSAGDSIWAVPLQDGEARRDIGNFESFFANFIRAALRDPEYGEAARAAAEIELEQVGMEYSRQGEK